MAMCDPRLGGLKLLHLQPHKNYYFSGTFKASTSAAAALAPIFEQDNRSLSRRSGMLHGLHWQALPHGHEKLVRVGRDAVLYIVVALRLASPTYGRHMAVDDPG